MTRKVVQAIPLKQGSRTLLLTALPAKDLLDLATIDRYNSDLEATDPKQGYQRPEEKARAKKISKYLNERDNVLLPTAVLLSARGSGVSFDDSTSSLTLDEDYPLQIVDGQHRIAGLRHAIHEVGNTKLLNFPVPVVIMQGLSKVEEMQQFATVNGTQKSVRTDLVNMILSQIMAAKGEDAIPPKDMWKVVVSRVIERLNSNSESVWYDMIVMPDQFAYKKKEIKANPKLANRRIVRATSFMQSLKKLYQYLVEYKHIPSSWKVDQQADKLAEIVSEYWKAIRVVCPEPFTSPGEYVIQKTPGVFSLHSVLIGLVRDMFLGRRELVQDQFLVWLRPAAEEGAPALTESFWRAKDGRAADFGSMKGFAELANIIAADIDIEL